MTSEAEGIDESDAVQPLSEEEVEEQLEEDDSAEIHAVLLDIEGTTTPIAFVYSVLFPYARAHLRDYLRSHLVDDDARDAAVMLRAEWTAEKARGAEVPDWPNDTADERMQGLEAYAEWLMQHDRKSPGLKLLQGRVWEAGYQDSTLRGAVFADVPEALERWRAAEVDVAIYSSGSELAQRLLFGTTAYGDLTRLLTGFFDTAVGSKTFPGSYKRIATAMQHDAGNILFVSDTARELDAAREAGMQVALCVRPGNAPQEVDDSIPVIHSFEEIGS